ncbi:MAG: hypothetical protein HZB46_10325 [Solirubrobacterales bacterium]|nr:hypothetical protein [Solirubrobacterales bacterium]
MSPHHRRAAGALAALALAFTAAPAAQAATTAVCNQATAHWLGGDYASIEPLVDSPSVRFTVNLNKLPANGDGLFTAAAVSPPLTVCQQDDGGIVIY